MTVEQNEWEKKLNNLHTRSKGISSEHQIDYKSLLKKVFIGKKVLDVGCGTCWLMDYLPAGVSYTGLDAVKRANKFVKVGNIEDAKRLRGSRFDTIFIFAALDGMRDLEKAFTNIKLLCYENVVILTGVNIEPDLYHTHLITEEFIDEQMAGFEKTVRVQVHPKIVFLEFTKK